MINNCLLCGVGGQGTVLASKLLAYSAMAKGDNVRTSETIGMAQRGGCVVSHVKIGDEKISSPLLSKHSADILIAFEPAEAVRCLDYLKSDGCVIVNKKAVKPITATLSSSSYNGEEMLDYLKKTVKNLYVVDGDEICEKCGSPKVLNIALLAVAAKSGKLSLTTDELKNAVSKMVKEKFHEINFKAIGLANE